MAAFVRSGGPKKDIYLGPPQFEGFETVQTISKSE